MISRSDITRDGLELVGRHVQLVTFGVLEFEVLTLDAFDGAPDEAGVARDAMVRVDQVVADFKRGNEVAADALARARWAAALAEAEDLGISDDGELLADCEATTDGQREQDDLAGLGRRAQRTQLRCRDALFVKEFGQAQGLLGNDGDRPSLLRPRAGLLREGPELPGEAGRDAEREPLRAEFFRAEALQFDDGPPFELRAQ